MEVALTLYVSCYCRFKNYGRQREREKILLVQWNCVAFISLVRLSKFRRANAKSVQIKPFSFCDGLLGCLFAVVGVCLSVSQSSECLSTGLQRNAPPDSSVGRATPENCCHLGSNAHATSQSGQTS